MALASWFNEARLATTGNISLSGLSAIDGVTPVANDRVLVKDQTTGSQNGIYVAASGAWSRAADFPTGTATATPESVVRVSEGTVNAHTQWYLTNTGSVNVGTTSLTFARVNAVTSSTTIANLQSLAGAFTAGDLAEVASYATLGDGGGGTFYFEGTLPGSATITNATASTFNISGVSTNPAGTPITITTSAAHGYSNGQSVLVQGVTGNTAANGVWLIAGVTSTTFQLVGSTGNGATSSSGGTVSSVTVTTSAAHGLPTFGSVMISRVTGSGGFAINGLWTSIGTPTTTTFTLPISMSGSYTSGGVVGDGARTIPSSALAARWVRRERLGMFNIEWFGAKGDNTTDNLAAFNATLAAAKVGVGVGSTILVPAGDFYVSDNIYIDQQMRITGTDGVGGDGSAGQSHIRFAAGKGFRIRAGGNSADGGNAFYTEMDHLFIEGATLTIGSPTGYGAGTVKGMWKPNTAYSVGDIVVVPNDNRFVFRCTVAGTSGSVRPMHDSDFDSVGGPNTGMGLNALPFQDGVGTLIWQPDTYSGITTWCNIVVHDVTITNFTNAAIYFYGSLVPGTLDYNSSTAGSMVTNFTVGSCGCGIIIKGQDASLIQVQGLLMLACGLAPLWQFGSGTGTISQSGSTTTLTVGGGNGFLAGCVGQPIQIRNATSAVNNGIFTIASVISPTQITYSNPIGVTDGPAATVLSSGGYGIVDQSPYGGTFNTCNLIENTGRTFYRPGGGFSRGTLIGCYAEGGQPESIWDGLSLGGELTFNPATGRNTGYEGLVDLWRRLKVGFNDLSDYPTIRLDDPVTHEFEQHLLLGALRTDGTTLAKRYLPNNDPHAGWWAWGIRGETLINRDLTGWSTKFSDFGRGFFRNFWGEVRGNGVAQPAYFIAYTPEAQTDPQLRITQGVGGHYLPGDRYEPTTNGTTPIGQVVTRAGYATPRAWVAGLGAATYDSLGLYGEPSITVHPSTPDGFVYVCTTAGQASPTTEPSWVEVTKFIDSATATAVDKGSPPSAAPVVPYRWTAGMRRKVGDWGAPKWNASHPTRGRNNHFYKVTAVSSPDADGYGLADAEDEPVWPETPGGTIPDGQLTWTEQGSDVGTYIIDNDTEWQCVGPEPIWAYYPPTAAAPVLSSLNHSQGDPLGGGASIVIIGTNLLDATQVSFGGTPATITANTATSITVTLPAKTAGTTTVSVTTLGGTSGTLPFEFWAPSTETTCTLLAERPNYNGTSGTWTARTGTSPAQAGAGKPTASNGAPVFAGSHDLVCANTASLFKQSSPSEGTVFCVLNPSVANASGGTNTEYNSDGVFCDYGRGSIGVGYSSTNGWEAFLTDGTYHHAYVALSTGTMHSGLMRWKDSTTLDAQVDGGSFVTTSIGAYSTATTPVRLGVNYSGFKHLNATMNAVATFNAKVSDAVATKCRLWAKQRHGAA